MGQVCQGYSGWRASCSAFNTLKGFSSSVLCHDRAFCTCINAKIGNGSLVGLFWTRECCTQQFLHVLSTPKRLSVTCSSGISCEPLTRVVDRDFQVCYMCTLWTSLLNLSIPDVPFPILLPTLIRSRFKAKPATLLIPVDFLSFSQWRSFTVLGTKVAPFPYFMWGVVFTACVVFLFFSCNMQHTHSFTA
jgi:hypothetical protein